MNDIISFLNTGMDRSTCESFGVYNSSVHKKHGCTAFMIDAGDCDLLVTSNGFGFVGETLQNGEESWTVCELTHENAQILRKVFPFTAPVSVLKQKRTVGVGDRLGIATPGHIRVFEKYDAYPVFA